MYRLIITPDFEKELIAYLLDHHDERDKIIKAFKELLADPDHPSLRTHKLNDRSEWSMSVDLTIRVTFEIDGENIVFQHIGTHDLVYRQ